MSTLGDQIKAARKEKRLSLRELASQMGVTVAAVSQWETGVSNPSNKNRAKLATILQIPASDLLEVYTEMPAPGTATDILSGRRDMRSSASRHSAGSLTVPLHSAPGLTPFPLTDEPLPVWQNRHLGAGLLNIERRVVGAVPRSEYLRYAEFSFALEIMHDDMSPAFERRDVAVINPDRSVIPGDDVLLVKDYTEKGSDPFSGQLRRLVKETDTHWIVRQFNPAKEYKLAKEEWPRALHVAGKRSR